MSDSTKDGTSETSAEVISNSGTTNDTPLTDAVFDKGTDAYVALTPSGVAALLDLAEHLERQLAEARKDMVSKREVAKAIFWQDAIHAQVYAIGVRDKE